MRRRIEFSLKYFSGADAPAFIEPMIIEGGNVEFAFGQVGDSPIAGRWGLQPTSTVSPTPISTPAGGGCTFNIIANPGGLLTGIAFRESPTRNSPRLNTILWNTTSLSGRYRLDVAGDVWYQVTFGANEGWIAAKIGVDAYVTNPNCTSPQPYPTDWIDQAQITTQDILQAGGGSCNIDAYLRTEGDALVLARIVFAEAARYNNLSVSLISGTTLQDPTGGIVFEDTILKAWNIRMAALLGLPNYKPQSVAGLSVSITEIVLTVGQYDPITKLRAELAANGCSPQMITNPILENVRSMSYPENAINKAELHQLWRIYQTIIVSNMLTSTWVNMPAAARGYEQFKGAGKDENCPAGADNLTRPGPGLSWAANQPYPPKTVLRFAGPRSVDQVRFNCYQDIYHLDDLFLTALNANTPDLLQAQALITINIFPKSFPVVRLVNPADLRDCYSLAQLTGNQANSKWPPTPQPASTQC